MEIKGWLSDKNGFTLIEILIALTIFSVGMLAVAAMQIMAIRGNRIGNEYSQAVVLAQTKIEELRSAAFSNLTAGGTSDPNNPVNETGGSGGIFSRSWVIANNTNFSRMITVTVSWTQGGVARNVILNTVTRGGGT